MSLSKIGKIFIIGDKDREPDRYNYVKNWLDSRGIKNYEFFQYCFKDTLKVEDIEHYFKRDDEGFANKVGLHYFRHVRVMKGGEISLAINHIKILERAVAENIESILILESDAIFADDFVEKWNNRYSPQLPHDWEVLVMGCGIDALHKELIGRMAIVTNDRYIYKNTRYQVRATEGTALTLDACKKVLRTIVPFSAPIDHEYDYNFYINKLNTYICEPGLVKNGSEDPECGYVTNVQD
jgi:GR25 family glycosyltransferase involved in LPS biosynthesis